MIIINVIIIININNNNNIYIYIYIERERETRELATYCGLLFQRWIRNQDSLQNIVVFYLSVEIRIRNALQALSTLK